MTVEYDLSPEWDTLKSRIWGMAKRRQAFKIGVTSRPGYRAGNADYRTGEYDEMIVMYKTSDLNEAHGIESYLIERFANYCDNCAPGGGGRMRESRPPYYVYVVR